MIYMYRVLLEFCNFVYFKFLYFCKIFYFFGEVVGEFIYFSVFFDYIEGQEFFYNFKVQDFVSIVYVEGFLVFIFEQVIVLFEVINNFFGYFQSFVIKEEFKNIVWWLVYGNLD